ncbi:MAG: threonine/serine dehydratase [Gemmatimonadetes bacterium]|nr:threonine/serine dehydratase [Gemmatimonadota bacterium]
MNRPTLEDIYQARARIAGTVRRTPLEYSEWLSELARCDVYLKLESQHKTRSFKVRGATNAVAALAPADRARGLVTASAGNHGQAVALAARSVGAKATVFVPGSAPETKKDRIRLLGADLRCVDGTYDDAQDAARGFAEDRGATFVHAFTNPDVVAGQGTVGLEIVEEIPRVREVIVPVGGGGLIAGIGTVMKTIADGDVRVIGVQTDQTSAMYSAFVAGHVVDVAIGPTLADGLAGHVDDVSYQRAQRVTDQMWLVDEAALPEAIRALYRRDGLVVEGAGAVGVAAILEQRLELRGPAVIVISGGNIDGSRLAEILTAE